MKDYNYNPISAKNLNPPQRVIYDGKVYLSHNALSKHLRIHSGRISEALRSGKELARVGGFVDEAF